MKYCNLRSLIKSKSGESFAVASKELEQAIFGISLKDTISIVSEIGIIPEDIEHDSSEEKLYTKASDIVFAKALHEMNFNVAVFQERSNCADIIAQSKFHNYSLVGDAKAFRLSRTAKNQKDFKVDSMVHWKGDNDYAVLACPYFQYPKSNSQIYKSALNGNVSLFSWEYLRILLSIGIKETEQLCLKDLWNQSEIISHNTTIDNSTKCFLPTQNVNIMNLLNITENDFNNYFNKIKTAIKKRGKSEIVFYQNEIKRIKNLDREEAIRELLASSKIESKINTIHNYIEQI